MLKPSLPVIGQAELQNPHCSQVRSICTLLNSSSEAKASAIWLSLFLKTELFDHLAHGSSKLGPIGR